MISVSRILSAVFALCLVGFTIFYYKTHHATQRRLASLESYQLSDQRFLVYSRYGFPLLSLDRSLTEKESATLPFMLKKLVAQDATVLHLGTHAGLHTFLIAKQLNDKGKILAFEGHPKFFALLKENATLHNLDSTIQPFPLIPSEKEGTLSVCLEAASVTSDDTTVNTSYEQGLTGTHCYDIQLKPLDNLSLPAIDFLLIENDIDVSQALAGGYDFLAQSKWPPILIVPSCSLAQSQHQSWINRLKKEGYYFYQLSPTAPTAFKVMRIDPHHPPANGSSYLFFSRELLPVSIDQ